MTGPAAGQPAPDAVADGPGHVATLDGLARGGARRLMMRGPSLFRGEGPYQDQPRLIGESQAPAQQADVAVPEPSSVALFGGFLRLLTCVRLGAGRRRLAASRPAASPQRR